MPTPEECVRIARRVVGGLRLTFTAYLEYGDFIAVGVEASLRSRPRFDPARGATFSTFAGHRIRGAVLDQMRLAFPGGIRFNPKKHHLHDFGVGSIDGLKYDPPARAKTRPPGGLENFPLDLLTARSRRIIEMRYVNSLLFKDIGRELGISESRVCNLHKLAIAHLRTLMRKAG